MSKYVLTNGDHCFGLHLTAPLPKDTVRSSTKTHIGGLALKLNDNKAGRVMSDFDTSDNDMLKMQESAEHREALNRVLYVTDAEMLRRMGISEKIGRIAIRELEKRQVFPARDPLFGNKRYWPAVRAFLDARNGVTTTPPRAI